MKTIEKLLKQMTLEEKAALCVGAGPWKTLAIERLGVPGIILTDGPHGIRRGADLDALITPSLPSTCFPTASALASTWNRELLYEMGQALAEEAIAQGVNILLGPAMNMKRSPLCGRNFEYISEDPYLCGEIAASLTDGIQAMGVGTSLKHFALNNQETRRHSISAEVDERTMREIYLAAFEYVVKRSKPWTVMCAYNRVNGTFCAVHRELLTDILKKEWGFDGLVMSDWGAVHDRVKSLKAGLDLEMPGPRERSVQAVVNAVHSGKLSENQVDDSARRILTVVYKAMEAPKSGSFDQEAHHALARKIAAESVVLLKNNGLLPLKKYDHIAVIGRSARDPYFQGGGASHINPTHVSIPYEELQKQAGSALLTFSDGYPTDGSYDQKLIDEAVDTARSADIAILFISLPPTGESEGFDRPDLDLPSQEVALIKAVAAAQPQTVVVLNNGSPVTLTEWIEDVPAVLEAWMMGQAGGGAVADILFGKTNPCGKLAETFPLNTFDTPAYLNWPGENDQVHYGEGLFIGYRYYDAKKVAVQFPFGYGLSYTTFTYSNPRASAVEFVDADGLTVSVDITNSGNVAGKETIQVYVSDRKSGLARPPKELKGFAKVELKSGETKTVSIHLDFRSFAYYHPAYQQWITEDGEFDILIGSSSEDIRCNLAVKLRSSLKLPCILNRFSTVEEWLNDPRGNKILGPMFQNIKSQMETAVGSSDKSSEAIGVDMMGFLIRMPLRNFLQFQEGLLPLAPEAMVEELLEQARLQEL